MERNLQLFISSCGPKTIILTGHDYAYKNLKFARTVFPENDSIKSKFMKLEEINCKLVPFTLWKDELEANIFLLAFANNLQKKLGFNEPKALLKYLRTMKDNY